MATAGAVEFFGLTSNLVPGLRVRSEYSLPLMSGMGRVMGRLNALYRASGFRYVGVGVHLPRFRDQRLEQWRELGEGPRRAGP